jgi:antirestriction protein ArdC
MSRPTAPSRPDVYARVTQDIIAAIEAGPGKFHMPWHHDGAAVTRPINLASGKPYRGINVVSLWAAAQTKAYAGGVWGTYRQWLAAGAQVRKGEQSSLAVLWKELQRDAEDSADQGSETEDRKRMFARAFNLFNADQVDGYTPADRAQLPESERLAQVEAFIAALDIPVSYDAPYAYYHLVQDKIFMPPFARFHDAHGFYATHLHECAHAQAPSIGWIGISPANGPRTHWAWRR